jgi:hypothetical protein
MAIAFYSLPFPTTNSSSRGKAPRRHGRTSASLPASGAPERRGGAVRAHWPHSSAHAPLRTMPCAAQPVQASSSSAIIDEIRGSLFGCAWLRVRKRLSCVPAMNSLSLSLRDIYLSVLHSNISHDKIARPSHPIAYVSSVFFHSAVAIFWIIRENSDKSSEWFLSPPTISNIFGNSCTVLSTS